MAKVRAHHLMIIDRSGSIGAVRQEIIHALNAHLQALREGAEQLNQDVGVSLVTSSAHIAYVLWERPLAELKSLTLE